MSQKKTLRKLLADRHNDATSLDNLANLKKIRSWLHHHKYTHFLYKRIVYGVAKRNFRYITGPLRTLPDFIIIGCQKCATTSLYDYICEHPNVYSATEKEIHFFDSNYNIGLVWYKSFFPTVFTKYIKSRSGKFVTGEASPMYIFNTIVPKRMSKILPKIKLIVILRNPVDRTYSHYNMQRRHNYESLSFEDAIKQEEERIKGEREKEMADENYVSINLRDFSYLSRGIYADQLKVWLNYFPRNQFLVLKTEDLEQNPQREMEKIFEFLELPKYHLTNIEKTNVGEYEKMNETTKEMLIEYFKPHNERLSKLVGLNFNWND